MIRRNTSLRPSRDGDRFHYAWAARRALHLLSPRSGLEAVVIEGPSPAEQATLTPVVEGEDVIDVSEYYGSEKFADASRIDYVQLKHTTLRSHTPWTASGIAPTVEGFAARFRKLIAQHGRGAVVSKMRFRFVSNRGIAPSVIETVEDLAAGAAPRHAAVAAQMLKAAALSSPDTEDFFARVELDGSQPSFSGVEDFLALDTRRLIVGDDLDAALRLTALVGRKATSEFATDPGIRRGEVLLSLRVGEDELLPAKPDLERLTSVVPREQEADLHQQLLEASGPIVITAEGGVGKSVVATRLHHALPEGSASVLYDCFGGGEYRRLDRQRHPCRVALTQMANELAFEGLCDPILPRGASDPALLQAFLHRLGQASRALRSAAPQALVLIVIDAADNAMMAAEGSSDPAFVPHLLEAALPDGVRLVMLCRPERLHKLQPPAGITVSPLKDFSRTETAALLRSRYPEATETQLTEFHRLTSQNPRVQANALATSDSLVGMLRGLGSKPRSVDDIIAGQLRSALAEVRKHAPEPAGIDALCAGLASLHPLVPISVLAQLADVEPAAVRSFANDFGRGRWLMIAGDAVQFRDEPVEDWFRKAYAASPEDLGRFADRLAPLAENSAYVASSLPALLLEANRLDQLVSIALQAQRLPADSPLERRDVEAMRVQHALKASLRKGRHLDAAKLAMKAAEVAAGSGLQDQLVRDHADLFGAHLDAGRVQAIVARGLLQGWLGARHAREAALCSQKPELGGEALSRLRTAEDLLMAWSRAPADERKAQPFGLRDQTDLAFAHLNLSGPAAAVREIGRWRPSQIGFETAQALSDRLIDHGRFEDVEAIAAVACDHRAYPIAAGVVSALGQVNRSPSRAVVDALLRVRRRPVSGDQGDDRSWDRSPSAVLALVEAAARFGDFDPSSLSRKLSGVLPKAAPDSLGERWANDRGWYLRAITLRDALKGRPTTIGALLPLPPDKGLGASTHDTSEKGAARRRVGGMLPWANLRARVLAGFPTPDLAADWAEAQEKSRSALNYRQDDATDVQDMILEFAHDVLIEADTDAPGLLAGLDAWVEGRSRPMFTPTWTRLARKVARTGRLGARAALYAERSCSNQWADAAERADSKLTTHVAAARALLSREPTEAFAHLDRAVEVAGLLGDEVPLRWTALLALGRAADDGSARPELAYRLARAGEFASGYMEDYFEFGKAVAIVAGLDATSAVAIVSRWRDRGVSDFKTLLESLEATLRPRGRLDPLVGASFLGLSQSWPFVDMMRAALSAADPADTPAVVGIFARCLDLRGASRQTWRDMVEVARSRHADTRPFRAGLARMQPDAQYGPRRRYRRSTTWLAGFRRRLGVRPITRAADAFALLAAQSEATRFFDRQIAWAEILAAVPGDAIAAFMTDLLASSDLGNHSIESVLEALPEAARRRLAVQKALRESGVALARSRWRVFKASESRGLTPERFGALTGLAPREVIEAVLEGVAGERGLADPQSLFELIPQLADLLSPEEAAEALMHGVGLVEAVMPQAFGDGPWRPQLLPPSDMETSIAGLIWGALSSPLDRTRWEAAHIVRHLFTLHRTRVLDGLAAHLGTADPGAWASPDRPFYRFNAELWCYLAVARAVHDHPGRAGPFLVHLQNAAAPSNDHVLIRQTAAGALLTLADSGAIALSHGARQALEQIDQPRLPAKVTDHFGGSDWYSQTHRKTGRFRFDYELARGDALSLANAFGLSADRLEKMAEYVILKTWRVAYDHQADDPRKDDPTWSRRGHDTQFQSHRDYLGYHALLTVAGQLARTKPPLRHESASRSEFEDWMRRFAMSRGDGLWLSDRLDAEPALPAPVCPDRDLWRWSVGRADLERAWRPNATERIVAGDWVQADGGLEQTVRIQSALVNPATAAALMAACQSAGDSWDYYIPSADQDEIDQSPFQLRGWITDFQRDRGLDAADPWVSAMSASPPRPAPWITRRFRLRADPLEHVWRSRRIGPATFRADLWTTHGDSGRDHRGPHGQRLMVRTPALLRMLRRLDRDLLVEVAVSRILDRSYGDGDDAGDYRPRSSFLILLLRQDGSVETAC